MRRYLWWFFAGLIFAALSGQARPAPVPLTELLGLSDQIIIGTVLRDERVSPDLNGLDGRATVRVDRALKGDAAGEIRVLHQQPYVPAHGEVIADDPGFDLAAGTASLFFLTRNRVDYRIVGGRQGVYATDEAERVAQAIAAFPVSVRMTLASPCYFDRFTPVTLTVENAGADPVTIAHVRLDGQYYAPRMGPDFIFAIQSDPPLPVTIPPKGTQAVTIGYRPPRPQSWLLFPPDSYLLAPVLARAVASVAPAGAAAAQQPVASPWVDTLIGYPLPAQ